MENIDKLTPMQKRFCEYYVKTVNGTQSAKKAGYSEANAHVQASKLLNNPKIKEYISQLTLKYEDSEGFGKDTAVQWLVDIARPTSREATSARLKAIQQLSMLYGWNTENKNINANVSTNEMDQFKDMTPAELDAVIQQMTEDKDIIN